MSRVFRAQSPAQRPLCPAVRRKEREAQPQAQVARLPDPAVIVAKAREEADAILADAKEQAAALIEQAEAERDRIAAEARAAGRNDGYIDGHAKGLAEAESLINEAQEALLSARAAYAQMLKDAEPKLLALVMEVSRRVVNEAFSADPDLCIDLVRKGLEALKDEREFSLRVDPSIVSLIEGEKEGLAREYGARSIDVVADPEVTGGAVIRTPHGYVDVTIESQIRNISMALAEARKKAMGIELQ